MLLQILFSFYIIEMQADACTNARDDDAYLVQLLFIWQNGIERLAVPEEVNETHLPQQGKHWWLYRNLAKYELPRGVQTLNTNPQLMVIDHLFTTACRMLPNYRSASWIHSSCRQCCKVSQEKF